MQCTCIVSVGNSSAVRARRVPGVPCAIPIAQCYRIKFVKSGSESRDTLQRWGERTSSGPVPSCRRAIMSVLRPAACAKYGGVVSLDIMTWPCLTCGHQVMDGLGRKMEEHLTAAGCVART